MGLFFKMLPDKLLMKSDKMKGVRRQEEWISVKLSVDADSVHKLKPVILGKAQNPECNKKFCLQLHDYYIKRKVWIVSGILWEFSPRVRYEKHHLFLLMYSYLIPENPDEHFSSFYRQQPPVTCHQWSQQWMHTKLVMVFLCHLWHMLTLNAVRKTLPGCSHNFRSALNPKPLSTICCLTTESNWECPKVIPLTNSTSALPVSPRSCQLLVTGRGARWVRHLSGAPT